MTFNEQDVPADAAAQSTVHGLVDYLNARDYEAFGELLDDDVRSGFLGAADRAGVVSGMNDLALRYPGLVFTRGELGTDPVVVAWAPVEGREYHKVGVLEFAFIEVDGETLVENIGYDDQWAEERLLAEEPDAADMPEGTDWQEWDVGES